MSDSKPVSMPAHLWDALHLMSSEMGVGPDALVAQAVFTLARFHGYIIPGKAFDGEEPSLPAPSAPEPIPSAPPPRVAPLRAESKASVRARPPPEPEPAPLDSLAEDEGNPFDEPGASMENDLPPQDEPADEPFEEPPPPPVRAGSKATLSVFVSGRDPYKMVADTLTIGRGKSCDFVIDSNRVSREHVRIHREGSDFVLEDLNSSNGTFFGPTKEKITRRKIKDGDEFTLGTEKVKFQIRK